MSDKCNHKPDLHTVFICPECKNKIEFGTYELEKEITELKQAVHELAKTVLEMMSSGCAPSIPYVQKIILDNPTVKRVMKEDLPEDAKDNYEDWRGGLL